MELKAFRITYLSKYNTLVSRIVIAPSLEVLWKACKTRLGQEIDPPKQLKTIEILDDSPVIM